MGMLQRRSMTSAANNRMKHDIMSDVICANSLVSTTTMTAQMFGLVTNQFNSQFHSIINELSLQRLELARLVNQNLSVNPDFVGARNLGVDLAWKYERADVLMGGRGSANWNYNQRQEILNGRETPSGNITHTIKGAEGHHQKNVVDHPEYQGDPDNIKFYKSRQEHLQKGHNGDWKNESDAKFINKDRMLQRTNRRRVIVNELKGAGMAGAIGFGIGFTISAIVELARTGIDAVEFDALIANSAKTGLEAGVISIAGYGIGRLTQTGLQSIGINVYNGVGYLFNYALSGVLTTVMFAAYRYVKLRVGGAGASVALRQVGKQTLFSLSILTVSIIVQGAYGGHAGLIVSTSVGLLFLSANVVKMLRERKFEERLREYTIEQYRPYFHKREGVEVVAL